MRRYETIAILRPNAGEEEINKVIETTTQIINDEQGTIIELNKWGMKKLAYLIKKETLGYYVFFDYAATPAAVTEIERKYRIDDVVLKYMTIKTAAAITEEGVQEAIAAVGVRAAKEAEATDADNESDDSDDDDNDNDHDSEE
ncbi:30S ribosomal protein S6 [Desulforhopalus sp. IMCC35007]|uniref:30S ribosomal protein S6 n=1 Tax=Desulforhopalus sp. IMCC35007 TaxID=2569543 RepID=UPI0010ADEC84|nr:30S ribosomal protein S6 [Desulforhopalus sp. IMCC35007]TKB11187.1 30S ribosomal protein S6 [Desulforhopalus sp. IMCC35007]